MKRITAGLVALILVFSVSVGFCKSSEVIAKVNGKEITQADLDEKLSKLPPQYQEFYKTEDGKKRFLSQYLDQLALVAEAKKKKFNKNKEFIKELKEVEENMLVAYLVKKEIEEKVKVSKRDIKKYYKDHKKEYVASEQVLARHILVKTKADADQVKKELDGGADFVALAKQKSIGPSGPRGGYLGWFGKGAMVPEFEKAAFSLLKGAVSKPVKTQFGYHIIKVEDRKKAKQKSLEDASADIERILLESKKKEMIDSYLESIRKKYKVEKL